MKTSLTTFEHRIRDWLLDLLHSQWRALGVPVSGGQPARAEEAIDPEALLWCSLEFFPTQPRLKEQALAWWSENSQAILVPRVRKFAQGVNDPRELIWQALDKQWRKSPKPTKTPCYGQKSVDELKAFCAELEHQAREKAELRQQPGKAEKTNAAVILRARDLLGNDARHFILVYLLANHGSAKLRNVAAWSGQSYRNISKVAQRWESAEVLTVEHGFARLKSTAAWESLLNLHPPQILLLNWQRFYDACIKLLRSLEKASAKSLPADGPVVAGLVREAIEDATASIESEPSADSATASTSENVHPPSETGRRWKPPAEDELPSSMDRLVEMEMIEATGYGWDELRHGLGHATKFGQVIARTIGAGVGRASQRRLKSSKEKYR